MSMFASLETFWSGRTPRERLLLTLLGALAAAVFVWTASRVALEAERGAERRYLRAAAALSEAQRYAAMLESRPAAPAPSGPVRTQVSDTAAAYGLTIASLEPGADGAVTVAISQAPPSALFRWLGALETQNGVRVSRLSAQPGSGETIEAQITVGPP